MQSTLNFLFYLALAFLFCHELDAIYRREWRLFSFLNRFDDETAYRLFIVAHIPLFVLFLWFVAYPAFWFYVFVDGFVVMHLGLHWWFRTHPQYEFKGFVSNLFIVGAAIVGSVHLLLFLFAS